MNPCAPPIPFAATTGSPARNSLWGTPVKRRPASSEPLAQPLESINATIDGWNAVDDRKLRRGSIEATLLPTSYLSRTYHKGCDVGSISLLKVFTHNSGPEKVCIRQSTCPTWIRVGDLAARIGHHPRSQSGKR